MGKTSHMDPETVVIEMKDIVKKFGDFTANDHISLTVAQEERSMRSWRERPRQE